MLPDDQAKEGAAAGAWLREWIERHPRAFGVVAAKSVGPVSPITLVEIDSKKSITFAWGQVLRVEQERSGPGGAKYLRVTLDDGRIFALTGWGIAFAPSFASTGALPDCPSAASFRDFAKLHRHLSHLVTDHDDEEHTREALQVLMVLLAFLDGARALGMDVGEEERALEHVLGVLESRGPFGPTSP